MSAGSRTDRLKGAARAQATAQSVEAFLAQFSRVKVTDSRRFRIKHFGKYFKKWEPTQWETVKRFAIWTNDQKEAAVMTMDEWDKSALMDLVCGFGSLEMEQA